MSEPRRSTGYQDRGADIEDKGLLWLLGRIEQRARLASPIRATGLHDTLGDIARVNRFDRAGSRRVEKGLGQWRDQLLRDQ